VSRRRRTFLLAGLALLLGGLAASDVAGREAALDRRIGPLVPVVVARADLPGGKPIAARSLAVRMVPARFAPRDALPEAPSVAGQRPANPVPAGADVTTSVLATNDQQGAPIRTGERVADVVATGSPELVVPGTRVDVLVTREAPRRTELALQDAEVLAATPAESAEGGPKVAASLRVTLRQAVYLAAAQSFARELRLLPRAAGDRRRAGSITAGAGG
jgi:pilus assembly protein CpaB